MIARKFFLFLIRGYQYCISPMMPPRCRYFPSCSSYAMTAIEQRGAVKGGFLALRRISRCHPWSPGGYDPVPSETHRHSTHCSCQSDQVKSS